MLVYKMNPRLVKGVDDNGETTVKINIPLQYNFALDMSQDLLSDEMFFEKIKEDVLPPVTDMEKIVIYPAVYGGLDDDNKPKLTLADEIEINTHFRQRWFKSGINRLMNEGWITNDTVGWTTGSTADEAIRTPGERRDDRYFWTFDERSDLVGYLGFDDNDIYYQKSKVKKSFLRLLFYDSMDLLNKNLLTYSTSFLDSGKLFTKYSLIRNNSEIFRYVGESENYENEMVMFEPGEHGEYYDETKIPDERYDGNRISSMVTLKDKYNDDASSDGFYIYLFKQDAPSEIPIDLYLKVEFNNAKYGRTVNLMLPIREDGDYPGIPIRFKDDDFPQDFNIEENGKVNFDFDSYYKSMFINVKCKFDKKLKKYVYYFPWDPQVQKDKMNETGFEYTVSNDEEKRKITLNFFEPRVNKAINPDYNGGG